jgi:AmmeMemoRadiSam system protein A
MNQAVVLAVAAVVALSSCRAQETAADKAVQSPTNTVAAAEQGQGKEVGKLKEHRSSDWSPGLTEAEQQTLFAVAKDTLDWVIARKGSGTFSFDAYTITPKLREKCATFVTFLNKGELRGCVGCLDAREPMVESIHTSASNAARDSRFFYNPIKPAELPQIEIHVSLLSPRRAIKSLDEFKIGEHGIWMEKSGRGAVYLPEVAVEQKWTKDETLTSLSQKAGLPGNAWRQGATFMVFSSVVITKE